MMPHSKGDVLHSPAPQKNDEHKTLILLWFNLTVFMKATFYWTKIYVDFSYKSLFEG